MVAANETRRIYGRAPGGVKGRGHFKGVRVLGNKRAQCRKVHLRPAQEGTKYARSKVETVETSFAKSTLEVELAGDKALPGAP